MKRRGDACSGARARKEVRRPGGDEKGCPADIAVSADAVTTSISRVLLYYFFAGDFLARPPAGCARRSKEECYIYIVGIDQKKLAEDRRKNCSPEGAARQGEMHNAAKD